MLDYLVTLGGWNWFILGALLLLIEVLAPGTFMLWLGLSAVLVGVVSLAVDWAWQFQLVAFAALSIVSFGIWWRLGRHGDAPRQAPFLNRRAEGFVGRVFTLEKPIVDGNGTVKIGDTFWLVRGPDTPAGSRIRVTETDGGTLVVAPSE